MDEGFDSNPVNSCAMVAIPFLAALYPAPRRVKKLQTLVLMGITK